jgi:hypothetical protein
MHSEARRLAMTLTLFASHRALAQGEGPRVYLPVPAGTQRIVPTYMNISSSFNLQQVIFLPGGSVRSNVGVLTYARFFGVAGRLSQVYVSAIYGSIGGSTVRVVNGARASVDAPRQTGFANPLVGVAIGLTGTPALEPDAFAKHAQTFQMYGLVEISPRLGEYDESKPLNPGTNRWMFRLGTPLVAPLGNPKRPVWLEVVPSVTMFTANTAPFGPAERRTQVPLWVLANTLSYNLAKPCWVAVDLRGQLGGETTSDDVGDNNEIRTLALAGTVAYAFRPKLTGQVSYGGIVAKRSVERGNFVRARLAYLF